MPLIHPRIASRSTITTVTAATTLIHFTDAAFTIPANTLVAGSTYRLTTHFQFVRGATATACNVEVDILVAGTIRSTTGGIATATAASTLWAHVEAYFTCLTTGAGGTGVVSMRMVDNIRGGAVLGYDAGTSVAIASFALNTTIANTLDGNVEMNPAIAGCQLIVPCGIIEWLF